MTEGAKMTMAMQVALLTCLLIDVVGMRWVVMTLLGIVAVVNTAITVRSAYHGIRYGRIPDDFCIWPLLYMGWDKLRQEPAQVDPMIRCEAVNRSGDRCVKPTGHQEPQHKARVRVGRKGYAFIYWGHGRT